jgi:hypothetical protein
MEVKKLDGDLTREQRIEVAQDVLDRIIKNSKKFDVRGGFYLETDSAVSGALTSRKLGPCRICARGALFLSSVDKYNKCTVTTKSDLGDIAIDRSEDDWGAQQIDEIENAFELFGNYGHRTASYAFGRGHSDYRDRLRAICRNIIEHDGEFVP